MDKVEDKTAANSAGDELEAAAPAPAAAIVEEGGGGGHVSSPAKEEVQGYRPGMEEGKLHYGFGLLGIILLYTHVSVNFVTPAGWGHNRLRTCAFLSVFFCKDKLTKQLEVMSSSKYTFMLFDCRKSLTTSCF